MKIPRIVIPLACALAGCSGSSGSKDGGGSGGSSSGGATSGGTILPLPDAGPLTASQICLALWAGEQRLAVLEELPLVQLLSAPQGTYCPAPTSEQLTQLTQQTNALAAELLTLAPPDGGWPDGSGPSICDNPATALDGLPAQIADSISTGRASWNAQANSTCAAGMLLSNDLLAYAYGDGGSFPGEAQTLGTISDGGGPCTQILEGQVPNGGSCVYPFDCAAGLYCQSTGADGSCAGSCAPLVVAGAPCGPLDECVGTLSCNAGFCGGPDAGPVPSQGGDVGSTCTVNGDCQPCLYCEPAQGMGFSVCTTFGLLGATCGADYDCGTPWLYCEPTTHSCSPAATLGGACTATSSDYACLDGWCNGISCQPMSAAGGPCSATVSSCLENLYCAQPVPTISGTCQPFPALGEPCGVTQGLSYECDDPNLYCNTAADAGVCASLPGQGSPCTPAFQCATGTTCETVDGGSLCVPFQTVGNSCAATPCQAGLACDAAGFCIAPLPGDAACMSDVECQSGTCVSNLCATPCANAAFGGGGTGNGGGGCENQGLSLLLGLGGALAWFDRRRRQSPSKG
jgi:hypothetical protein